MIRGCGFADKQSSLHTPHYGNVPFKVPDSWVWCRLDDLCNIKGGKRIPKGKSFATQRTEHIYLRVTNMKNRTILFDDLKYIDDAVFQEIRNYTISSDDLYLTIAGTIGDVGEIPQEVSGMNLTENAAKLTDIGCNRLYLMYSLLSTNSQEHFSSKFHQVAQPKLSIETASSTLLPLPPLAEQQRIVTEIERWFTLIDQIEQDKSDLQTVIKQAKSKILDLAIHGKLVPQNPNDEPAAELLKRINPKAEIPCDNGHYQNVPDSWCITDIKSLFTINPKNKVADDVIAGFVPMTNILDGYSNEFRFEPRLWGDIKKGFTHFADGDIVVAKISPCLENRKSVIVTSLPNGIGAGTTELFVFRSQCVLPEYGLYFFKSDFFINHCVGTFNGVVGQQRVSKSIIENIKFLLPPISEQRRIVDAVHKVFAKLDAIMESL